MATFPSNEIDNNTDFGLYCAYSYRVDGQPDAWGVDVIYAKFSASDVDIDYIRPVRPHNYLLYVTDSDKIPWVTNGWWKVRQFTTTVINNHPYQPHRGILQPHHTLFGIPTPALIEAAKYNNTAKEGSRGVLAVQETIALWEQMIDNEDFASRITKERI